MALTIVAADIEQRLRAAADRQGIPPETYLLQLVSKHLPPNIEQPAASGRPFYETASAEEWIQVFERWVDSHPRRAPLPDDAFERFSFYSQEA